MNMYELKERIKHAEIDLETLYTRVTTLEDTYKEEIKALNETFLKLTTKMQEVVQTQLDYKDFIRTQIDKAIEKSQTNMLKRMRTMTKEIKDHFSKEIDLFKKDLFLDLP